MYKDKLVFIDFTLSLIISFFSFSSFAQGEDKLPEYYRDFFYTDEADTGNSVSKPSEQMSVRIGFADMGEVDLSNFVYIAKTYSQRTGLTTIFPKSKSEVSLWAGFSKSFLSDLSNDKFGIYENLYLSKEDYEYDKNFLENNGENHSCYFRIINKNGYISGFILFKSGVKRSKFYTCVHRAFMTMHGFHVNTKSKINSILSDYDLISPSFIDLMALDELY